MRAKRELYEANYALVRPTAGGGVRPASAPKKSGASHGFGGEGGGPPARVVRTKEERDRCVSEAHTVPRPPTASKSPVPTDRPTPCAPQVGGLAL